MPPAPPTWTSGAPKWAAIIVLGGASLAGLGWAFGRDSSAWGNQQPQPPTSPAPTPQPIQTKEPAPTPPTTPAPTSPRKLLNLNTATQTELELLPGVGPALAKRILDYRATHAAFKRLEDLDPVKGIGPRLLDRLRPLVTFE